MPIFIGILACEGIAIAGDPGSAMFRRMGPTRNTSPRHTSEEIMFKPFAYSFDRETFRGEFATREEAAEAGQAEALKVMSIVEAVYVAKRVPTNPQADMHGDDVVKVMKRRMLSKTGDASYLAAANEHVVADLDAAIEHAIVDWLKRHELSPADKFSSISEHPLPSVHAHAPSRNDEVGMMGADSE